LKGIDPQYLDPKTRFGKAFYVAEKPGTTLAELAHHNAAPTTGIRFSVNKAALKPLDLTDPKTAQAWGYKGGPITPQTQAIGENARQKGYNAIRFNSERDPGGVNYAVLDNHNDILQPVMVSPTTP
jgi:hypothetical protein